MSIFDVNVAFTSLSLPAAVGGCIALAGTYVLSLYVVQTDKSRDHPDTIKRRVLAVSTVTLGAPAMLYLFGRQSEEGQLFSQPLLNHIGMVTAGIGEAAMRPLLLNMLLFAGPLVQRALDGELVPTIADLKEASTSLMVLRNFIVAPITEEIVFRSCMVPLLLPQLGYGYSLAWITPLFFGIAHIHHILAGVPLPAVAMQLGYTTVFGAFATYSFFRTGNILGPILAHAFSNYMGFPDFGGVTKHKKKYIVGPAYVLGLSGFLWYLGPWTDMARPLSLY